MLRLATWDAIGGQGGTNFVTPSMLLGWLDWALVPQNLTDQFRAVGVKTTLYTDPNRTRPGDFMYTSDETTFAHDCSGARIPVEPNPDPNTVLMDPHSQHLWQLWQQMVQQAVGNGYQYDMIYEDTADEMGKVLGVPCNFDQTDWTNQTNAMDSALGFPVTYNGLANTQALNTPPGPSTSIGLNVSTVGGMAENCYVTYNASPVVRQQWWEAMENTEIAMAQQHKTFLCKGSSYDDAAANTWERIYQYASILMTYDPHNILVTSLFSDPLDFHVFPEVQFIALQPLTAEPTYVSQLLLPSGVYGREYKECFLKGQYVGACAVAVDDNSIHMAPKAFPWPTKYHRTLAVAGYDVLEGGSVSVSNVAPPSTMNSGTAVIAIQ